MAMNPGKTALFLAFKIKKTELLPVLQMNPAKSTVKNPHGNDISVFQCRSLGRAKRKQLASSQPRPQGLLAFQYGGDRREDPGTQQKSRD